MGISPFKKGSVNQSQSGRFLTSAQIVSIPRIPITQGTVARVTNNEAMTNSSRELVIGGRTFSWGSRTYVMGVLNVTPDSFSGDGTGTDVQRAVDQALRFEDDGADIIDIGGESSRPVSVYKDAHPVSDDEEVFRAIPVIEALTGRLSIPLSIDTQKSSVTRLAIAAGAAIANDVSMFATDRLMPVTVAELGVPVIINHTRERKVYPTGVVTEVVGALKRAASMAEKAGVPPSHVILDPGIGFGKTAEQSIDMQRGLSKLVDLGYPVLIGTSRKASIGEVLGLPVDQRLEGTAATVALAIERGADIVRVHDVKEMARVARMSDAIVRGWTPSQRGSVT
jgi:dihydropteroate synthase